MYIIDTHCHLFMEPLDRDGPAVLARASEAGVRKIVVPAYDLDSWQTVAELAESAAVYPALGLHPWAADQTLDLDRLEVAIAASKAVAVGEIGLDLKISEPGRARQVEIFSRQVKFAIAHDLPIILHCRGAFDELLTILGDISPGLRGVVHAYSRGPELAQRFVDLGLHLGFGGAITRPRALRARRSAEAVPLESIVLETDAPSIGLDGVDPEDTEPRHVADIARTLADIRGMEPDEVAEATTKNAERLFSIG